MKDIHEVQVWGSEVLDRNYEWCEFTPPQKLFFSPLGVFLVIDLPSWLVPSGLSKSA